MPNKAVEPKVVADPVPSASTLNGSHMPRVFQNPFRRRLPLVVVLGFAFTMFVLISIGSVLAINYRGASQSTRELMQDKARLTLITFEQRVRQRLEPVQSQVEFTASLIAKGLLDPNDVAALTTALRSSVFAAPQVTDIAFVATDLRGVRVSRQEGRAFEENWADRLDIADDIKTTGVSGLGQWRAPRWSPTLGQTILSSFAPVSRNGTVVGIHQLRGLGG
jgi:hypothetical protein